MLLVLVARSHTHTHMPHPSCIFLCCHLSLLSPRPPPLADHPEDAAEEQQSFPLGVHDSSAGSESVRSLDRTEGSVGGVDGGGGGGVDGSTVSVADSQGSDTQVYFAFVVVYVYMWGSLKLCTTIL